jgi:hypothetical protein
VAVPSAACAIIVVMSTPANKLNDDQRMEYQEIGEFARHDDTIHLTMSSVLIPVLIGTLGWAWEHHDVAIPLAFGSLVLVRGKAASNGLPTPSAQEGTRS